MKTANMLVKQNRRFAKQKWPDELRGRRLCDLASLSQQYKFSIALGDITLLEGKWYVTHAGLLRLAHRRGCAGIRVQQVREFCDASINRWVFKASVYRFEQSVGFIGYGDADPTNVTSLVRGAEMRVAETRAVNRALRKAYGIGLCSVEELGWSHKPTESSQLYVAKSPDVSSNGHHNAQPRLRDQLCLLIRQYNLDPNLVKAYAAHFCGTETIKAASRDLVESFISHLAASAKEDLDGLICKLNSFAHPPEVQQ